MGIRGYCKVNNLNEEFNVLSNKLEEIENARVQNEIYEWAKLGTVSYSLADSIRKTTFSTNDTMVALEMLGVDLDSLEKPKWFNFWVDKDEFKIRQALHKLKTK